MLAEWNFSYWQSSYFSSLANWISAMRPIDSVRFIELNWNQSIITIGIRQLFHLSNLFISRCCCCCCCFFFILNKLQSLQLYCTIMSKLKRFFFLLKESQSIVYDCGKISCGNDFVCTDTNVRSKRSNTRATTAQFQSYGLHITHNDNRRLLPSSSSGTGAGAVAVVNFIFWTEHFLYFIQTK